MGGKQRFIKGKKWGDTQRAERVISYRDSFLQEPAPIVLSRDIKHILRTPSTARTKEMKELLRSFKHNNRG